MGLSTEDTVVSYIALGSNIGDSLSYLKIAIQSIKAHAKVQSVTISRFYRSKPHGPQDQADYLNAALRFETSLGAEELLVVLQQIENENARVREGVERWGARTLDLDLLFYGDKTIRSRSLTVPHPRICDRVFVLYPLRDLLEDLELTTRDLNINDTITLQDCIDKLPEAEINNIKDLGYV
jgi:2-amino-4-hydroxy-6-hydroxymethyldihydropteridine diphosphokinase